jgi:flavin-binding protein dodecin
MSIAKVVEITSDSTVSLNDAIEAGIRRAEKSLKNVRGGRIQETYGLSLDEAERQIKEFEALHTD